MKKITFLCIFVVGALFSSIVKAETVLFCQSELIVGFFNDGGSWRKGNFANERYTIKFNNDYSKLYGLDEMLPYNCLQPYLHAPDALACLSGFSNGQSFIFNKRTKRFVFSFSKLNGGYDINGPDTDFLAAGTCKKF